MTEQGSEPVTHANAEDLIRENDPRIYAMIADGRSLEKLPHEQGIWTTIAMRVILAYRPDLLQLILDRHIDDGPSFLSKACWHSCVPRFGPGGRAYDAWDTVHKASRNSYGTLGNPMEEEEQRKRTSACSAMVMLMLARADWDYALLVCKPHRERSMHMDSIFGKLYRMDRRLLALTWCCSQVREGWMDIVEPVTNILHAETRRFKE